MVLIDYMTMAISTCVSAAFVLLIPFFICFSFHEEGTQSGNVYVIMAFLFVRYVLIGLLVQCAAYSIVYSFAIFQKRGGSVCAVPFFLYPLFMLPMEFLSANGKYISLLDFSAGRYYTFAAEGSTVVNSVLHYNAHLLVYLGFYIFISVRFLAGRWEFSEGSG
ncbi:MAG: hypothetical protein LUC90_09065 [Lachnospiraceae bacterium]|nr:hypothetical protein [Lachnospiraceae bacterium]